jgi:uncharacterized protein (TIGR02246 family)
MAAVLALSNDTSSAAESPEDVSAIRKRAAEYVEAYNRHDAAALAELWADDAVYLNRDTGEPIEGRDAIREMFAGMFQSGEASELGVGIQSIRLITPDVAIEDGVAEIRAAEGEVKISAYTAIHVKKNGAWYLHSVRETDAPSPPTREPSELDQLAWLVGQWVDEAEDATVHTSWQWAKNEHFLTSNFSVSVGGQVEMEGTQVIGWDPVAGQIRSWVFDSEGGFGDGVWRHEGNQWIVEATSTLNDGSQASATNVYTPLDDNTFTWKSTNRVVEGDLQDDVAEVLVHRQVDVASTEVTQDPMTNGGN